MKRFLKNLIIVFLICFIALFLSFYFEEQKFLNQNTKKLQTDTPITLVFAGDDNYVTPLSVALTSLNMNTKTPVEAFILTEGFSDKNKYFFRHLDHKLANVDIRIVLVESSEFEGFPVNDRWSKSIYFRYLIPTLLPSYKRALYLDGDLLILKDLNSLFHIDLKGNLVAGVSDLFEKDFLSSPLFKKHPFYINSGVLLMDLENLRYSKTTAQLFKTTEEYKDKFTHYDQDAINLALNGKIMLLPTKYNAHQRTHTPFNKTIYHYSGKEKPWKSKDFSFFEWNKYASYTQALLNDNPWPRKAYINSLLNKIVYYPLFFINKYLY